MAVVWKKGGGGWKSQTGFGGWRWDGKRKGEHTHTSMPFHAFAVGGGDEGGRIEGEEGGKPPARAGRPPAWWVGWGGKERLVQF